MLNIMHIYFFIWSVSLCKYLVCKASFPQALQTKVRMGLFCHKELTFVGHDLVRLDCMMFVLALLSSSLSAMTLSYKPGTVISYLAFLACLFLCWGLRPYHWHLTAFSFLIMISILLIKFSAKAKYTAFWLRGISIAAFQNQSPMSFLLFFIF